MGFRNQICTNWGHHFEYDSLPTYGGFPVKLFVTSPEYVLSGRIDPNKTYLEVQRKNTYSPKNNAALVMTLRKMNSKTVTNNYSI